MNFYWAAPAIHKSIFLFVSYILHKVQMKQKADLFTPSSLTLPVQPAVSAWLAPNEQI